MNRFMVMAAALGLTVAAVANGQPNLGQMPNAELIAKAPMADDWRGGVPPVAAEIRKRILDHKLSDDDWRSLLRTSQIIYTRLEWPEDKRLAIGMVFPVWLTDLLGSVSAIPRLPHAVKMSTVQTWGGCALGNDDVRERRRYQEVGDLRADAAEVVLDVEFRVSFDSAKPAWAGTLTIPLRAVRSPSDGLSPVRDPKLDAILLESVTADMNKDQGEHPSTHLWLYLQPARTGKDIDPDIGLHLTLTVMDGERTIGSLSNIEVGWKADNICLYGGRVDGLSPTQLADQGLLDRLSICISVDRSAAFRDLKRSKFWDGRVIVPLKKVLNRPTVKPKLPPADAARPPAGSSMDQ